MSHIIQAIGVTPLSLELIGLGLEQAKQQNIFQLPLQKIASGVNEQLINISVENNTYVLYFQNNVIENNLFLSCYGSNQSPIYFGSYRCVFGNYINVVDNGFPYLVFFVDSTNNNYQNITFDTLNNGVQLYVQSRN